MSSMPSARATPFDFFMQFFRYQICIFCVSVAIIHYTGEL
jgi:hypothetical protein